MRQYKKAHKDQKGVAHDDFRGLIEKQEPCTGLVTFSEVGEHIFGHSDIFPHIASAPTNEHFVEPFVLFGHIGKGIGVPLEEDMIALFQYHIRHGAIFANIRCLPHKGLVDPCVQAIEYTSRRYAARAPGVHNTALRVLSAERTNSKLSTKLTSNILGKRAR